MPLFSKSSTSETISSSGAGSSGGKGAKASAATTNNGPKEKSSIHGTAEADDESVEGGKCNYTDGSPLFSTNSNSANGSSPSGITASRMSSSFNQSSSYNRTFERKVFEESTPTVTTTRMFTSSPLHTIKSTLGSGFPSDLGVGSLAQGGFAQPHNYQFGSATSGSFHSSDDQLNVTMDCAAFAPEDLKVSVVCNQIVIEGKHAEKQDALGSIERHFVRKFNLPRNAQPESVSSNLTSDGMLTVTASAPKMKDNSPARTIPIKIVSGGAGNTSATSQQNGSQFQQNGQ